jgi:hypothetical protein
MESQKMLEYTISSEQMMRDFGTNKFKVNSNTVIGAFPQIAK